MTKLTEAALESVATELLEEQGYSHLTPEQQGRGNLADVVLRARLQSAIDKLNPDIPASAQEQALREVLNVSEQNLIDSNQAFHQMLTDGVGVEYQKNGNTVGGKVWLVDFKNPFNNEFLVCDQFSVSDNNITRRPDLVLLVNGLPLVVIELKNPDDPCNQSSCAIYSLILALTPAVEYNKLHTIVIKINMNIMFGGMLKNA